ncbi:MAG: DUF4037 domain-containing protein [Caldilineaceae bacterium]|nr:DUF4037 domain-containing protein [Caldilineaceae bacterium]
MHLLADEGSVFIPGLTLCRDFYREAVRPILADAFPGLAYSAALIGSGSEVLGFDDEMSTDHHWGPRVQLFVSEADYPRVADAIHTALANRLPYTFQGYSTHFSQPDPNDNGVQHLTVLESGPVNHRVSVSTIRGFVLDYLDFDLSSPVEAADWLTFPQQKLRALTSGAVYHDGLGIEDGLEEVRARFAWYPPNVWLYLLAAGWARIGQEEHLMGRAGLVGDELGSALIGSRLARDVMRLAFTMEQQYAPYPKWFGTAFSKLQCAAELTPHLLAAQTAPDWQTRESHLVPAYEALARMHNRLGLTDPLPETVRTFWGRPFRVIAMQGFADALLAQITDPDTRRIAARQPIGSIDTISDNTDLLEGGNWRPVLRRLWSTQD